MKKNLNELENRIGYVFKNKELLETALTHSSYVNELKTGGRQHNERMEFLGDAVLEMVSSEYIYHRFPEKREGEMSKLRAYAVCEEALFERAKALSLPDFVILGTGARQQGGAALPSIQSDALEAVIAGIFLDGGIEEAKRFILNNILEKTCFDDYVTDPKSALQQYFQAREGHPAVTYEVIDSKGASNNCTYTVTARVGTAALETGTGRSIKAAEKDAASKTLKKIREMQDHKCI